MNSNLIEDNDDAIHPSSGLEIFTDPFKSNFDDIWSFFSSKYESDISNQIDTYYRYGNNIGTILSEDVFSLDNILLYASLLKDQVDYYETYDNYLKLQETSLWYQNMLDLDEYGFIRSVNGTTGEIIDNTRYLIDNAMPIIVLFENIGDQINSFMINSKYPKDSIEELFNLLDSDQFWDDLYSGFYNHNSTTDKYAESNFYAILALLKIHKYYEELGLDVIIKNRAYQMANQTMDRILEYLWDDTNGGFEYYSKQDWSSVTGSEDKYLITNAIGILCLLEYWKESGMESGSLLFQRATYLFNKLEILWNSGFDAYEYSRDNVWDLSGADRSINLEANSVMMLACLRLFAYTGNLTYYNRAFDLHETFESSFYDIGVNAYDTSINSPVDTNKNFYSNLKLAEAYVNAFDVFNNTILTSNYNLTDEVPDYKFDQDTMNITSKYSFIYTDTFFNTSTSSYEDFTIEYIIDAASITYVYKDPENKTIHEETGIVSTETTTFLYDITDDLKIGEGYSIYVYANTSKFGTAFTLKQFNVVSGLIAGEIKGLPTTLYQGPVLNITIPINNTRNNDVELNVTLQGPEIVNQFQTILFVSNVLTNVTFNLTTVLGANIGSINLNFSFYKDNITFLELIRPIEIGYSFDYTNFLYQSQIVRDESALVSLTLINFLPNSTQTLNISFFEGNQLFLKEEILLKENEIKTAYFSLLFSENESFSINTKMEISIGETLFYTEEFIIEIMQKFEIISASFPETIAQGESANFILVIRNNQPFSESFVLLIDGVLAYSNYLSPGINNIDFSMIVTLNPYDFQIKYYTFELRDSGGDIIARYYFQVNIELSAFNLVVFYILPFIIPVAIVLYYKNKEIKHRLLKR